MSGSHFDFDWICLLLQFFTAVLLQIPLTTEEPLHFTWGVVGVDVTGRSPPNPPTPVPAACLACSSRMPSRTQSGSDGWLGNKRNERENKCSQISHHRGGIATVCHSLASARQLSPWTPVDSRRIALHLCFLIALPLLQPVAFALKIEKRMGCMYFFFHKLEKMFIISHSCCSKC